MENLALISAKPVLTLTLSPNPKILPSKQQRYFGGSLFVCKPRSKTVVFAHNSSKQNHSNNDKNNGKNVGLFARISKAQETTSVAVNPQPYVPPPNSQLGSPLFWIGVGVGFSAVFSFAASWLKKYAMQQAFKSMMGSQNNQYSNTAFPSGSPFGFPPPSTSGPSTVPGFPYQPPSTSGPSTSSATAGHTYSPPSTSGSVSSNASPSSATPAAPAASMTMDVSANKPEVMEPVFNDEKETKIEAKQSAFVDISPDETSQASPFESYADISSAKSSEVAQNGSVSKESSSESSQETRKKGPLLSVETLEKMLEDPVVQKMIYPQLPEEMRNPATFKWMLQNPVYRQQLQEMLDNMSEGSLDDRVMEGLKNFDLNSPEVKQQFDQIGLTPEEAMSKLMANPDIAMAFQNPKIQQALLDCSQNPMNLVKYQNDKEVMDIFNKMQELFPGSSGF